jgi:hypothetical protein
MAGGRLLWARTSGVIERRPPFTCLAKTLRASPGAENGLRGKFAAGKIRQSAVSRQPVEDQISC